MTHDNATPRERDREIARRLGWEALEVDGKRWIVVHPDDGVMNPDVYFSHDTQEGAWEEAGEYMPRFSEDLSTALTCRIEITRYPDGGFGIVVFGLHDVYNAGADTPAEAAAHVALGWLRASAWQRADADAG